MAPSIIRGGNDQVKLTINGRQYSVGEEIKGDVSLNTFIREHAQLKGTKFMCLEGGCGTCIVMAKFNHPTTRKPVNHAVNSCLVPLLSCHGWEITTVEGVGNKFKGYHQVQKRLAAANGTQCGYCSPGMVMNMYSLLQEHPTLTMKEIENSFGGNICRCTGYRPILDAFKTFASDAPSELKQKIADIEDSVCPTTGQLCKGSCKGAVACFNGGTALVDAEDKLLAFRLKEGSEWYRPNTVQEIFEIFDMIGEKSYRIIAGNTGHGVYRIKQKPEVYVDINGVGELHGSSVDNSGVTLGANINLTEAMELFYTMAKEKSNEYGYCKTLADHIDLIANVPVRNGGTFGGNLFMKHEYKEFPSDIFLILEMVGAQLVIHDSTGVERTMCLLEFLDTDMHKKIIKKIKLPPLNSNEHVVISYKIMPRAQNAHAYVNAGFMFRCDKKNKFKVLELPTIVFGGIKPEFVHACKTEEYLKGKELLDNSVLQKALDILNSELEPDHVPPDATPEYRRGLALSLFYKFILSLNPDSVDPKFRSGGPILQRGVSSGKQDFDTNRDVWPLNKPVPKLEAIIQSSGEAEYSNDIPKFPDELWAQLVISNNAGAEILSIDPSQALAIPGVVAFFQAKDIPGLNSYCPQKTFSYPTPEKIFAEKKVEYSGQAVGLIVAETHALAVQAAMKVKVNYGKVEQMMFDLKKIIKDNIVSRIAQISTLEPKKKKDNVKFKVKGEINCPSQYHNCMELLTCVSVPSEDNIDIYPSSQWPSIIQEAVTEALNIPEHRINIRVRRLGGGYGGKITLATHTALSATLAAVKLHRPVRLAVSLENGMHWSGKRFPIYSQYEAGVDENGEIQFLEMKMYQDNGINSNDSIMSLGGTLHHLESCYDSDVWSVKGYGVTTDKPSNTWCRAPGSVEAISAIETILEHIAKVTGKEPDQVRKVNMRKDNPCIQMLSDVKALADYDNRVKAVDKFNKENRWKKRGLSLVPMDYPFWYFGQYHASVSIYKADGTVAIGHGAIEMGQGCNTKAAQVAAHILGIDLEMVTVKPTDVFTSPNNMVTGASVGSELICYAIMKACQEINERLKPIKEKLGEKATWKEIVLQAFNSNVNLRANYMYKENDEVKSYNIYGVVVSEVECDILTGQYQILRMDVIEDAGESLSPEVDIGQIEGSIVMGIGLFTLEELVNDEKTGMLLTDRTWNYKPPGAKDIPIDFRTTLRKKAPNPFGVLRSKATGEPPLCLSVSVIFAMRRALESARKDSGEPDEWFSMEMPYTREKQWLGSNNKKEHYKI